uniref:Ribosomal protein S14 n=1 Tax=Cryptomonas curvata TaxID=233186 RepID=A0A2P1G8E7_9CRYP|nr:ribosomal protein S14 [Cryptomonas curvata]AVM81238.1 ribosomal protein S14 [Cryptomonas curvata]
MKLKKKLLKDILIRKNFKKNESKIISLKVLLRTNSLNYLESLNNFSKLKTLSFSNKAENKCFVSSRTGSVYKKFTLSRIKTREFVYNGLIPGLKKHSW